MDSPSRGAAASSSSGVLQTPTKPETGASGLSQEVQQEHVAPVDPVDEVPAAPEVEDRPIAKGGYQREMRKRRNKAAKQARAETDDEETEVGSAIVTGRCADSKVDTPKRYRKPRRDVARDPHALRHSEIPALLSG